MFLKTFLICILIAVVVGAIAVFNMVTVSYTHLDVYKRQTVDSFVTLLIVVLSSSDNPAAGAALTAILPEPASIIAVSYTHLDVYKRPMLRMRSH